MSINEFSGHFIIFSKKSFTITYCIDGDSYMRKITLFLAKFLVLISILVIFCNCNKAYAIPETIRVGFPKNTPPFQFIDNQGKPAGMHIDIIKNIAEVRKLSLEFIPFNNSIEAKTTFIDGEIDLLLGIGKPLISDYNLQRTINLSSVSLSLFVPKDIANKLKNYDDYKYYSAVFEYDTVAAQILTSIPVKYFTITANQIDLIDYQIKGKSDLIIGAKESVLYQLNEMGLEKEYEIINKHLGYFSYVIQVGNKERELFHMLEHEMAQLQVTREYERIYNKWIIKEENQTIKRIVKNITYIAGVLALLAMIFIYLNMRVRTFLKKKIEEQTFEIRKTNKQLETTIQQIQNANELRDNIIKYSPRAMVLFKKDYNITLINKSACYLAKVGSSITGSSVLGLPIFGYILKSIKEEIFEDNYKLDNKIIAMDGGSGIKKDYRFSIQQIWENSQVTGALITVEDITVEENKKRELHEKEKNQMLNKVVAGLAHEIRNPLTSIQTFVTLAKTNINNKRLIDFFEKYIPDEVNRINRLVESLINYAKPSKNKKLIINVSTLLHDCAFFIKSIIENKKIVINENIVDNLNIYADKDQIKQVFINILLNSIESMEEKIKTGGNDNQLYLEVSANKANNDVIINLRDEGMGIKDEVLECCMDPFFTTKRNGTGIGLALTKQYIEENNGKISIESQVQKYTLIKIEFRRYKDEAPNNHYR